MDALILSCGTGGGHNSAARALLWELNARGHHAVMLNPYTLRSQELARKIDNTYISMVQNAPRLFGAVYTAGQLYRKLPCRSPVYHVNHLMVPIMEAYLATHTYDVVIMTHLYPAEILTNMKNRDMKIPKTLFVSTDYVCIPFTEETVCDAYAIPAPDLAPDYVDRGIPQEKLHPFGIPTSPAFSTPLSKEEARRRLHLDPSRTYILTAGGSMGGGTIRETIEALMGGVSQRPDVSLIIVCGNNKELYQALMAQQPKNTVVVGYTEDMADYMRASDLFVTKPGGLSSTEAAVCGIPILHTAAIPGCESYNAEYFRTHGMSLVCQDPRQLMTVAMDLLSNPAQCEAMVARQHAMVDGSARADICAFAQRLVGESTPF